MGLQLHPNCVLILAQFALKTRKIRNAYHRSSWLTLLHSYSITHLFRSLKYFLRNKTLRQDIILFKNRFHRLKTTFRINRVNAFQYQSILIGQRNNASYLNALIHIYIEVVGSNLARGKIFTASIGSVDSLYPSVYICFERN